MKVGLVSLAGIAICAAGVAIAANILAPNHGEGIRLAIYQGGLTGGVLGISGLPFVLIISRIAERREDDTKIWTWWGLGMLARMALLGILALALNSVCDRHHFTAATRTLMAVYLTGMFSETIWLVQILLKNDRQMAQKKA